MTSSPVISHRNTSLAVIVYQQVISGIVKDQQDILVDVEIISKVLQELGYETVLVPVTLNLDALLARLQELQPQFVFNMVDSLVDHDRLIQLVPAVLDEFRIPFTGVSARGHFLTTDKILAKELMGLAGIPTPLWQRCSDVRVTGPEVPFPCIVKPVSYDASRDINEKSVCETTDELQAQIARLTTEQQREFFAEQYIDGREFNISVVSFNNEVRVLPPAEMTFVGYPDTKPKIVDFKAKWVTESFEYAHTVRSFDFPESDAPLLGELKRLSKKCWSLFGLCGYARVDFRVDKGSKPFVLEVNANPCIAPDAGFVAAAGKSGLDYTRLIQEIVQDAQRRAMKQIA